MLHINASMDISQLQGDLAEIQRQIPFATSYGINKTAQAVKKALYDEMKNTFEAPTPFTLNSLFIEVSTKEKLQAQVWLKDDFSAGRVGTPADRYIPPMIFGGPRPAKSFEVKLRAAGILESGMLAVPGENIEYLLDKYGNLSAGLLNQMRSQLLLNRDIGVQSNVTSKSRRRNRKKGQFFVMGKEFPIGIGRRVPGDDAEIFLKFVREPNYQAGYFDFFGVAQNVVDEKLDKNLQNALAYALRTAN